jgi:hypothetical protein
MHPFQGANEGSASRLLGERLGVLIRRCSVGPEMQNNAGPRRNDWALSVVDAGLRWKLHRAFDATKSALCLGFPGNCTYMTAAIAVSWRSKQATRTKYCTGTQQVPGFRARREVVCVFVSQVPWSWMEKRRLSRMLGSWACGLLGGDLETAVDTFMVQKIPVYANLPWITHEWRRMAGMLR